MVSPFYLFSGIFDVFRKSIFMLELWKRAIYYNQRNTTRDYDNMQPSDTKKKVNGTLTLSRTMIFVYYR